MSTVVIPGKMASTNVDSFLKSVQYSATMDNGSHIVLGAPVSGQHDVYTAALATDVTKQEVLIVESPVLVEINGYRIDIQDPSQFTNAANRPARARHLKVGDEIKITADGITGSPAVNGYAVPVNGSLKLAAAADLTGGTVIAYEIVDNATVSIGQTRVAAYKLRVVKSL